MKKLRVIDSHSGGEPTRVVIEGGPDLGSCPLDQRREIFRRDFDRYRSAVVNEPRGSDVMVGALLVEPADSTCCAGVIFFNNTGYLSMCGHGTIGVVSTLAHLGRITTGKHRIQTPVGIVTTVLHENGEVSVTNVPSWRAHQGVKVEVPNVGLLFGDIAWGGNWFYLVEAQDADVSFANVAQLTELTWRIRRAANEQDHPEVDHVELFGPPSNEQAHSKNFVLCPGGAYDRSACGTGTSAKLACLAADGKLAEGAEWIQESIIGSTFRGSYRWLDRAAGRIEPTITGRAFVNADTTMLLNEGDPFCWGFQ